ncbi:MAG TPA: hypothetical protein QGI62_09280 [Anaerolineales bacterium]|jgi:hypothetical protein|nr:hypothetical protein [Anaerolineales bacterium]|tara:strand:- start:1548 stop:1751 length:204 start_codon:yes stop_codon:yes gene_type:complete
MERTRPLINLIIECQRAILLPQENGTSTDGTAAQQSENTTEPSSNNSRVVGINLDSAHVPIMKKQPA